MTMPFKPLHKLFVCVLFLTSLINSTAYSQTQFRWLGNGADNNWSTPLNWDLNAVPQDGDDVIFDGCLGCSVNANKNCTVDVTRSLRHVEVNGYTGIIFLAAGNLTTTGNGTFSSGRIAPAGSQKLILDSPSWTSIFGGGCILDIDVTSGVSGTGSLYLNGAIFNGLFSVQKVNNIPNISNGGNTFNSGVSIDNVSNMALTLANVQPDIFSATSTLNLIVSNSGASINFSHGAAGSQINGNITLTYAATGNIFFGANGGTSTLTAAAGITVSCGGSGCGNLSIQGLTAIASAPLNFDLTQNGNPNASLTLGPNCNFARSITGIAPSLLLNGVTCTGATAVWQKTGISTDNSAGGNDFSGTETSLWNAGSGIITLGNNAKDIFGKITVSNTGGNIFAAGGTSGGGSIYFANGPGVASTEFQGDIILNNAVSTDKSATPVNKGIYFSNCATCFSMQSARKTISEGTGTQLVSGELRFQNFTQAGGGIISVNLDMSTLNEAGNVLYLGPGSTLGGAAGSTVTLKATRLLLNGCTFNGVADLQKLENSNTAKDANDVGLGGNTFNGVASITNSSVAGSLWTNGNNVFNGVTTITNNSRVSLILESVTGTTSTYNGAVTFVNDNNYPGFNTDLIEIAYAGMTLFNSTVTLKNKNQGYGIFFCRFGGSTTAVLGVAASIQSTTAEFPTGILQIQNLTQTGAAAMLNLQLGGTSTLQLGPSVEIFGNVDFRAPQLLLNGVIYRGNTTYLEKTTGGSLSDLGEGGNMFLSATSTIIKNSSATHLRTKGNNIFSNGTVTIENSGSASISLEYTNVPSQDSRYNTPVTFTNSGVAGSYVQIGFSGTTEIYADVMVYSTGVAGSGGVYFGDDASAGGSGSVLLMPTHTITAPNFSTGELHLTRFTQSMDTDQDIRLTGDAGLVVGPASSFDGDIFSFVAPTVRLDGCTFNRTVSITQNGPPTTPASNQFGKGGNVFQMATSITNSGTGIFASAAKAGGSFDVFNGVLTLTNSSSGTIRLSDLLDGTEFNQDVAFNSTGAGGIYLGNSGGKSTLADTKLLSGTSNNGTVLFKNFTQTGSTAQTLLFTGATILALGPGSTFEANTVNFSSGGILLNGTDYKGMANLIKTDGSNDYGTGGNIFEMAATLTNSATSSGEFRTADGTNDIFMDNVTLSNFGTGNISVAYNNPTPTIFQKNVIFNSTNSIGSSGVYIGVGGSSGFMANLGTNSSLQTGISGGVSGGKIFLGRLQQPAGVTLSQAMMFSLNGNNALLHIYSSYFRGDVNFKSPRILLENSTFEGINQFTKTGTVSDDAHGGNKFTGGGAPFSKTTTFTTESSVSSGVSWAFSNSGPADTFDGPLIINKDGDGNINLANNVSGPATQFNNTVVFNSSASNGFITTGLGGGSGVVLSAPGVITPLGGLLSMGYVADGSAVGLTRLDAMGDQTINSATGQLIIGFIDASYACHFRGALTLKQRQVTVQYSTFDGNTTIEKTGSGIDASDGGNTFGDDISDAIVFKNSGAGTLRLANITGDTFNGSVSFVQPSGILQPAYNGTNNFYGDISAIGSPAITFGTAAGNATFLNAANQTISGAGSPIFQRVLMSKSGGRVTLNTDINIGSSLIFNAGGGLGGIIYSDLTHYLNFADGATTSGAGNTSYVEGPVKKTGSQNFTFPIGMSGLYRSIDISVSGGASSTDAYIAQYFSAAAPSGTSVSGSLAFASGCEYWSLNRTAGSNNVFLTMNWDNHCTGPYVTDPTKLRIANLGANWFDIGSNLPLGMTISSSSTLTSYGLFALATTDVTANPLPITLVSFEAKKKNENTVVLEWKTVSEINNFKFEVQKSTNGTSFNTIGEVKGAGTTSQAHTYSFIDSNFGASSYYKLKQIDIDGNSTYTEVRRIQGKSDSEKLLNVYPNPTSGTISLQMENMNENESVTVNLIDLNGSIISTHHCEIKNVANLMSEDLSAIAPGVSILQVITQERIYTARIIKK